MADIFSTFSKGVQKSMSKKNPKVVFDSSIQKTPIGTGSIIVDTVLEGGIAYVQRMTEISSMESGGKTTLALLTVAQALKQFPDKGVIYLDSELALDYAYMKVLGVDPDDSRVMIFQPTCIEEADEILTKAFDPSKGKVGEMFGNISVLVVDSVATLRPRGELQAMAGEGGQKALHATAWGAFAPKLNRWAKMGDMAVLLVNQFRSKPMIDQNSKYSLTNTGIGNGHSNVDVQINTTGGNALKYFLSARYITRFSKTLKDQVEDPITGEVTEERVSNMFKIVNIKNKVTNPYKSTPFVITFGLGIDDYPIVYDSLKAKGVIGNNGSFMLYTNSEGEVIKILGKMKFNEELKANWFDDMKKQYLNISDHEVLEYDDTDDGVEEVVSI